MAKLGGRTMSMHDLYRRFETLVAQTFSQANFAVSRGERVGLREADLVLTWSGEVRSIVEVKLYTANRPPLGLLRQTIERLDELRAQASADHAILVTNVRIDDAARLALAPDYRVIFYDRPVLDELVRGHPAQAAELYEIDRQLAALRRDPEPSLEPAAADVSQRTTDALDEPRRANVRSRRSALAAPRVGRGEALCSVLKDTKTGRNARAEHEGKQISAHRFFEIKALEALKYLFEGELTAWKAEFTSQTASSRYDAIAKISSDGLFWRTLVEDFDTRYVIFEFKNYGEKIKQTQIYTTEKYLYRTARRATAIILSRHGPDTNAKSATIGALREAGKLIIHLTLEDLCKMLNERDAGTEPTGHLSDLLDEMLMRMER